MCGSVCVCVCGGVVKHQFLYMLIIWQFGLDLMKTACPYVMLSGVDHLGAGQFVFMMTNSSGRSALAVVSAMTVGKGLWFFPIWVCLWSA